MSNNTSLQDRRRFLQTSTLLAAGGASSGLASPMLAASKSNFKLKYLLASSLYGYAALKDILPEVSKAGGAAIDLWPMKHGNQREQLAEMGEAKFAELLSQHQLTLGCITQYPLGPFGLQNEMRVAHRLGCRTIVTGGEGPINLKGAELKKAVGEFIQQMQPHLAIAEETGVTIAIENHARNLIDSPDSLRYLAEMSSSKHLGIAFAPYHLPQDEALLAQLLRDVLPRVEVFYAWQHGNGCMTAMPKEQELLQMPGRGPLDFAPMLKVLAENNFQGWTEIFMHPFPRGIPILDTPSAVTGEVNLARTYLDALLTRS
ncbi:MAG: sugar phosphate isomerase/epimerase [Pirellulaceae bacterium]|nr:sugar phosphate isomerase/epimerase [Pirellulaceae bacterium]